MSEVTCSMAISASEYVVKNDPIQTSEKAVSEVIDAIDCCRRAGKFELAEEVVLYLKRQDPVLTAIVADRLVEQESLLGSKDSSACEGSILHDDVSLDMSPPIPLWVRGWNFATAMARHATNGFKRSSPELLETRLAQCQACPELENDHCKLCGCACVAENRFLNKIALESEKCPLGKW